MEGLSKHLKFAAVSQKSVVVPRNVSVFLLLFECK